MKKLIGAATVALAFAATPAAASTIIGATSAIIDAGGPGFGSIDDTFNQAGLNLGYTSGVTDFDSYIASDPIHTLVFAGNEWFSNNPSTSAQVTYDLGSAMGIDRLALWNEESAGIGTLDLLSSLDGITFSSLGTFVPTPAGAVVDYSAQVFGFSATNARYVRFAMSDCPAGAGAFNSCAIGEVAFRSAAIGAIPEPTTWAMLIFGFGAIGGALRNKKRKTNVSVSYA
ncbi:hypothetical protein MNBD_ALPHA04-1658 [hydrothermal vent metagenome]|uniref:Ice-binding protein C-terminal domain-containing protein n=1 Tax=hydrothermal vent metagenome TaxID=652676 RepID=A0A3B0RII4_9ZZZZ